MLARKLFGCRNAGIAHRVAWPPCGLQGLAPSPQPPHAALLPHLPAGPGAAARAAVGTSGGGQRQRLCVGHRRPCSHQLARAAECDGRRGGQGAAGGQGGAGVCARWAGGNGWADACGRWVGGWVGWRVWRECGWWVWEGSHMRMVRCWLGSVAAPLQSSRHQPGLSSGAGDTAWPAARPLSVAILLEAVQKLILQHPFAACSPGRLPKVIRWVPGGGGQGARPGGPQGVSTCPFLPSKKC